MTKEIIRLKALLPDSGCRSLADAFNRRFAHRSMTVGKTFVSGVIRRHQYEIQILRRRIKHAAPKTIPFQRIWGIDLTGKVDEQSHLHVLLGIVEHHSRACLTLTVLREKTSVAILRLLLDAIERFGRPAILRSDNEAIFTSRLFRLALWLPGIRHQRIEPHCPWQNGRVERFFGTLKAKLNLWTVDDAAQLNLALSHFRLWYNHVRPHQNLGGRTPAEVWRRIDVFSRRTREYWFETWDGMLGGFYLRT